MREIYIDESSQTKHRYLVLGGIIVNLLHTDLLSEMIWEARHPDLPQGEMKWTKVSSTKYKAYERVVDVFFAGLTETTTLEFYSLVVDTTRIRDKIYNSGSRDIGFNKEIYQLCMKFARLHAEPVFHVYPDRRNTPSRTSDLRDILNMGRRKAGDPRDFPFRRVHFRDSEQVQCLQLVDVLIGAVAFKLNGHYSQPGASEAKRRLCDHILRRAGINDVTRDTPMRGRFTIWHRKLR